MVTYSVAPRYSPGSPASVDERTFKSVCASERTHYAAVCEGLCGDQAASEAAVNGLHGVALEMTEHARKWLIRDALTELRYMETTAKVLRPGQVCWVYTGHANRDLRAPKQLTIVTVSREVLFAVDRSDGQVMLRPRQPVLVQVH